MIEPIKPLIDAQTDWTFKKAERINRSAFLYLLRASAKCP